MKAAIRTIHYKNDKNEQYTRRETAALVGLVEQNGKTEDDIVDTIVDIAKQLGVDIEMGQGKGTNLVPS